MALSLLGSGRRSSVGGAELKHRGGSCSAHDLFDEGRHCVPTCFQITFEAGLSNDEVVDRLVHACAPPKTSEPRPPSCVNLALQGVNDPLVCLEPGLRLLPVERPLQGARLKSKYRLPSQTTYVASPYEMCFTPLMFCAAIKCRGSWLRPAIRRISTYRSQAR